MRRFSRELAEKVRNKYHPRVTELDLSYEQISVIENLDLLPSLVKVDLSSNAVKDFDIHDVSCLPLLEELNLSSNQIETVRGPSTSCNPCIKILDLRYNAISNIDQLQGLHAWKESLTSILLSGNPVARRNDYRKVISQRFPWLRMLDGVPFVKSEQVVRARDFAAQTEPPARPPRPSHDSSAAIVGSSKEEIRDKNSQNEVFSIRASEHNELHALVEARNALNEERTAMQEERTLVTQLLQQLEAVRASSLQHVAPSSPPTRHESTIVPTFSEQETQASLGAMGGTRMPEVDLYRNSVEEGDPDTSVLVSTLPVANCKTVEGYTASSAKVDSHTVAVQTNDSLRLELLQFESMAKESAANAEAAKSFAVELQEQLNQTQLDLKECKTRLRESSNSLQQLRKENASLTLQVQRKGFNEHARLEALESLLVAQERAIVSAKDKGEIPSAQTLVTLWREKVFQLLVQDRAARLETKRANLRASQESDQLRHELDMAQEKCERLRCERQLAIEQSHRFEKRCHELSMSLQQISNQTFRSKEMVLAMANKVDNDTVALGALFSRVKNYEDRLQSLPFKMRELSLRMANYKETLKRERTNRQVAQRETQQAIKSALEIEQRLRSAQQKAEEQGTRADRFEKRALELEQEIQQVRTNSQTSMKRALEEVSQEEAKRRISLEEGNAALLAEISAARVCVKQQERELARLANAEEREESSKVLYLEDRLRRRETEVYNLRRERNALLGTLRDAERRGLLPGLGLASSFTPSRPGTAPQEHSVSHTRDDVTHSVEEASFANESDAASQVESDSDDDRGLISAKGPMLEVSSKPKSAPRANQTRLHPERGARAQGAQRPLESFATNASLLDLLNDADAVATHTSDDDDDDEDKILEMLLLQAVNGDTRDLDLDRP